MTTKPKAKQRKAKGPKLRECWAIYHPGTGDFIRAIDTKPDRETVRTMPVKYVHMREVSKARSKAK